jgi:hypothetical protein
VCSSDLGLTNVAPGVFQADVTPPPGNQGFFRIAGLRAVVASFDSADINVDESVGTVTPVIVFNGPFQGTVRYTLSGTLGLNNYVELSGQVLVNGTTAAIPISLGDNITIDSLRYLTLRLEAGAGYQLGAVRQSTITIEENDARWQGVLQNEVGTLGFLLTILNTNTTLSATLGSGGFGFFPSNAVPAQLASTADAFACTVANIQMPASSTLFNCANNLTLHLSAANGVTNQTVSSTQVRGAAELIITVPDKPYLDTRNVGTFVLLKPPTAPSTNEVPLTPVP